MVFLEGSPVPATRKPGIYYLLSFNSSLRLSGKADTLSFNVHLLKPLKWDNSFGGNIQNLAPSLGYYLYLAFYYLMYFNVYCVSFSQIRFFILKWKSNRFFFTHIDNRQKLTILMPSLAGCGIPGLDRRGHGNVPCSKSTRRLFGGWLR